LPRHGTPDLCGVQPGPGVWWTSVQKISEVDQCLKQDFIPGITLIKYYNPPDYEYPDEVTIY
jgi:hypothetical protein